MEADDIDQKSAQVTHQIHLMFKNQGISYPVAICAMANAMIEIYVHGYGWTENEAKSFLASLFLDDKLWRH